jgi:AhpD family alkylhydroperoxidase
MMLDWNDYQKQLGGRLGELSKLSPDTLKGYLTLSAANAKTTLLGEKMRQLISLSVAVTSRCDGCIVFHTDAALKAERRELRSAGSCRSHERRRRTDLFHARARRAGGEVARYGSAITPGQTESALIAIFPCRGQCKNWHIQWNQQQRVNRNISFVLKCT